MEKVKIKPKLTLFKLKREKKEKALNKVGLKQKNKQQTQPPRYEMLVTIVNRGKGEEVINCLKNTGANFSIATFGVGTANSSIANLLSLYDKEKEVVFAIIKYADSEVILDSLEKDVLPRCMGISFTLPLKSITNHAMDYFG